MSDYFEKQKILKEMEEKVRQEEAIIKASNSDPFKGWNEREIEAAKRSPQFRDKVEDSVLSRKIRRAEERRLFEQKRLLADLKVQSLYPEASDPGFQESIKQVIDEYELHGNPNARLIAARLARLK